MDPKVETLFNEFRAACMVEREAEATCQRSRSDLERAEAVHRAASSALTDAMTLRKIRERELREAVR